MKWNQDESDESCDIGFFSAKHAATLTNINEVIDCNGQKVECTYVCGKHGNPDNYCAKWDDVKRLGRVKLVLNENVFTSLNRVIIK